MPSLFGRNGHIGSQFQAVSVRLPGATICTIVATAPTTHRVCRTQICRFCWHHIKENLNRRCPACRREYTDEAVQFKPINKEE